MEIIVYIAIWSAIIYRASTDIAYMDGPFDIFCAIREFAIVYAPSWVSVGIQCPICISFWFSCILVAVTGTWEYFAVAGIVTYLIRNEA